MIVKELFAKLGLDVDMTGFTKADTLMAGAKAGLAALVGLTVAAGAGLTALVLHTAETAFEIQKMAQMSGVTTDAVQELGYAAERSGLSAEQMGEGLIHLAKHMAAAKQGSEEQAKAFATIGVKVTDASGHLRDAGDVLEDVAEHFKSMPDGTDKTALSMQLFGRAGAQLIPVLNKGRDGLEELRKEAHALGIVLDDDAIEQSGKLRNALLDLKINSQALGYAIAVPLMGSVTEYVKAAGDWIRANREVTKQRVEKVVQILRFALTIVLVPLKVLAGLMGYFIDNWRLIAVILGSIVLAALVVHAEAVWATVAGYIALGAASVRAAVVSGAAWVAANLPLILLTALFIGIILLMDDVAAALRGDNSLMAEWLGNWKDDNQSEAWWLRDLKSLAYLMLHFGPIMDFWKEQFNKLWEWLKDGFADTWNDIVIGVKKLFGVYDPTKDKSSVEKKKHYAMGYTHEIPELGTGEWKTNSLGESLWYPTTTPDEQANAAFNARQKQLNMSVQQMIVAQPGQSPAEIANESRNQLDDWHQQQLAEANAEFGSPL